MGSADDHDTQFTDDEFAFLRHARFGELPRVDPDDRVELTETDPRRDVPEHVGNQGTAPYNYIGGAH